MCKKSKAKIIHINKTQLKKGIQVEMEHFKPGQKSARLTPKQIALSHLKESPNYYIELSKMERKLRRRMKK